MGFRQDTTDAINRLHIQGMDHTHHLDMLHQRLDETITDWNFTLRGHATRIGFLEDSTTGMAETVAALNDQLDALEARLGKTVVPCSECCGSDYDVPALDCEFCGEEAELESVDESTVATFAHADTRIKALTERIEKLEAAGTSSEHGQVGEPGPGPLTPQPGDMWIRTAPDGCIQTVVIRHVFGGYIVGVWAYYSEGDPSYTPPRESTAVAAYFSYDYTLVWRDGQPVKAGA